MSSKSEPFMKSLEELKKATGLELVDMDDMLFREDVKSNEWPAFCRLINDDVTYYFRLLKRYDVLAAKQLAEDAGRIINTVEKTLSPKTYFHDMLIRHLWESEVLLKYGMLINRSKIK